MSRPGLCLIILVSVLHADLVGGSASKTESADALTPESYSLYSAIYHSQTSSGELLGIAAVPESFPRDLTCVRPSTAEEREMASAARNQVVGPIQWKRQFEFGSAYILIPPPEINKAIDCIQLSKDAHPAGCESYANLHYVRFLSIPIFNKDQTRVLVVITRSCGGLCGNGGVFVYHKTKGGWELEKNSFAECHWVS